MTSSQEGEKQQEDNDEPSAHGPATRHIRVLSIRRNDPYARSPGDSYSYAEDDDDGDQIVWKPESNARTLSPLGFEHADGGYHDFSEQFYSPTSSMGAMLVRADGTAVYNSGQFVSQPNGSGQAASSSARRRARRTHSRSHSIGSSIGSVVEVGAGQEGSLSSHLSFNVQLGASPELYQYNPAAHFRIGSHDSSSTQNTQNTSFSTNAPDPHGDSKWHQSQPSFGSNRSEECALPPPEYQVSPAKARSNLRSEAAEFHPNFASSHVPWAGRSGESKRPAIHGILPEHYKIVPVLLSDLPRYLPGTNTELKEHDLELDDGTVLTIRIRGKKNRGKKGKALPDPHVKEERAKACRRQLQAAAVALGFATRGVHVPHDVPDVADLVTLEFLAVVGVILRIDDPRAGKSSKGGVAPRCDENTRCYHIIRTTPDDDTEQGVGRQPLENPSSAVGTRVAGSIALPTEEVESERGRCGSSSPMPTGTPTGILRRQDSVTGKGHQRNVSFGSH